MSINNTISDVANLTARNMAYYMLVPYTKLIALLCMYPQLDSREWGGRLKSELEAHGIPPSKAKRLVEVSKKAYQVWHEELAQLARQSIDLGSLSEAILGFIVTQSYFDTQSQCNRAISNENDLRKALYGSRQDGGILYRGHVKDFAESLFRRGET